MVSLFFIEFVMNSFFCAGFRFVCVSEGKGGKKRGRNNDVREKH